MTGSGVISTPRNLRSKGGGEGRRKSYEDALVGQIYRGENLKLPGGARHSSYTTDDRIIFAYQNKVGFFKI